MKKIHGSGFYGLFLLIGLLVYGCATLQIGTDATADEKARAAVSDALDSLDVGLTGAKAYIVIHPEKLADYKAKIVPILAVANDSVGDAIVVAMKGEIINGPQIATMAAMRAIDISLIIASWKTQTAVRKAPVKATVYVPPTWPDLQGKQLALKQRIASEK